MASSAPSRRSVPSPTTTCARLAGVFAAGQFEANSAIDASLAESYVVDLPPDYWQTLPEQFRGVTAQQVQAAAGKYLAPERMGRCLEVFAVLDGGNEYQR
jgi:zinc protease